MDGKLKKSTSYSHWTIFIVMLSVVVFAANVLNVSYFGKLNNTKVYFRHSVDYKPETDRNMSVAKGLASFQSGNNLEAIRNLESSMRIRQDESVRYTLARALMYEERFSSAKEVLLLLSGNQRSNYRYRALYDLSLCYVMTNNYLDAKFAAMEVIDSETQLSSGASLLLGDILELMKQYQTESSYN